MPVAATLVVCCLFWLPHSLQQVVPAALSSIAFCRASQEDLRVLPSSGFSRSVLRPFTSTTTPGAQAPAPVPAAAELSNCLFQSFDPAFDSLIGDNRTIYQVGPTSSEPWAVESPAYLSGALPASIYPEDADIGNCLESRGSSLYRTSGCKFLAHWMVLPYLSSFVGNPSCQYSVHSRVDRHSPLSAESSTKPGCACRN